MQIKWEMKNWQRADGQKVGMETRKTDIAMGDCIKTDLERAGEDCKKLQRKEIGDG